MAESDPKTDLKKFLTECEKKKEFHFSLEELADKFYISDSTVSRYLIELNFYHFRDGYIVSKRLLKKLVKEAMHTKDDNDKLYLDDSLDFKVFCSFRSLRWAVLRSENSEYIYVIYLTLKRNDIAKRVIQKIRSKRKKQIRFIDLHYKKILIHVLNKRYAESILDDISTLDELKPNMYEVSIKKLTSTDDGEIFYIYLRFDNFKVAKDFSNLLYKEFDTKIQFLSVSRGYILIETVFEDSFNEIWNFIQSYIDIEYIKKRPDRNYGFEKKIIEIMKTKGLIPKDGIVRKNRYKIDDARLDEL